MLKLLVVGHRGAGKSSFMRKLQESLDNSEIHFISLDDVVEHKAGMKISEIFANQGEKFFRVMEVDCLREVIELNKNHNVVVDLGAGFSGEKPEGFQCLWLQRSIDLSSALFLDRPNLDQNLQMSEHRFAERERRYEDWADFQLAMREGVFHDFTAETEYFATVFLGKQNATFSSPWTLTLLNEKHCKNLSSYSAIDNLFFELRDDLLSAAIMEKVSQQFPLRTLISFRKKERMPGTKKLIDSASIWDWPLEWGGNSEATILSLHQREVSLQKTLASLPNTDQILKLAVHVHNFKELEMGYRWSMEDPQKRVFLPNSPNGRWAWFRQITADHSSLSFLREAKGSSLDQPTLLEALAMVPDHAQYAAILASPAKHSFTPSFHREYFFGQSVSVLRIDVESAEWDDALPFLTQLGLRWAAVSSPNKENAARMVQASFPAVNTLFYNGQEWEGTNTDIHGFSEIISSYRNLSVAVWGGGGVIPAIEANLPNASFYSSRTGELKKGDRQNSPDVVVWAVGGSQFRKKGVFPPPQWKPQLVVDLNYAHNSPGIQCASNFSCQYRSGLDMFVAQAKKQQEYWNERGFK